MANRSRALRVYWASVHAVQARTGARSSVARAAVRALRDARGYTLADIAKHPRIVARTVRDVQTLSQGTRPDATTAPAPAIATLRNWQTKWDEYEGEYDVVEIETSVDY